MASAANPQHQSNLLTRLPREILDQIYLEIWRICGLCQHILLHGNGPAGKDNHFRRWQCCTEYRVDDTLQADVEKLRARLDVPLGTDIQGAQPPEIGLYCRRLMSPWRDHWPCGERATQEHGIEAISGYSTSDRCWKTWRDNRPDDMHVPSWSPYLPMLLTCKLVSAHCLKSIYESITLIFIDLKSIQAWFGHRQLRAEWKIVFGEHVAPPAFHKYARSFELSLDPDLGGSFICGNIIRTFPRPNIPMTVTIFIGYIYRASRVSAQ
ncbi:hypothetical protein BDV95DRAFT_131955 [Massariosphaeria phaeospora]|uniref:Uncharacterized protein n=1 Tax=Massariosphaeria phaeospora TaxID=100035 RepID=A0A7C8MI24_9PLEO|nr:hypothetical protein BDV95DRAFT_131955 [Massariosphaeria phaeospora]